MVCVLGRPPSDDDSETDVDGISSFRATYMSKCTARELGSKENVKREAKQECEATGSSGYGWKMSLERVDLMKGAENREGDLVLLLLLLSRRNEVNCTPTTLR